MRRQTGNEQDLIDVFGGIAGLANQLDRTASSSLTRGLQAKEIADKERQDAINNRMTLGLGRGESPDELAKITSIPGEGWKQDYDAVNAGLKPEDKIKPQDFTRSSDTVGPADVAKGLKTALDLHVDNYTKDQDMKFNEFKNTFASMPMDAFMNSNEVKTGDFSAHGKYASAAARAAGVYLSEFSKIPEEQAKITEGRKKLLATKYNEFVSNVGVANTFLEKGNTTEAGQMMVDVVNGSNLAQKAALLPDGKIQLRITENGKDTLSDKTYTPKEFAAELNKIKWKEFSETTWAAAEHAKQFNEKSAANPELYINPKTGDILSAHSNFDIWSGNNSWFITKNGVQTQEKDLAGVTKAGYVPYKREFYTSPAERRMDALNEEGKRLDNQGRAISNANATAKGVGKPPTVTQMKYLNTEWNKDAISKNFKMGIDLGISEEGILYSLKPLNEKQNLDLQAFAESRGYSASTRPNENGGYDFKGFVIPDKAPVGAAGLGGGDGHFNKNRAALEGKGDPKGKTKDKESDSSWFVPMEREPGAEKAVQAVKKVVGRVGDAFSTSRENTNQIKLDKLKKERVKYPNDKSLKHRISQLEKAMGQ